MPPTPRINLKRLQATLKDINAFGFDPKTGGFDRVGYSDADMAVRGWFCETMNAVGLTVRRDGAGNVFGRFGPSEGPAIVAGSHLDTVPQGGAFDGALGVAVALECVLAMREAGFVPKTAIEVVATAEEEGRFGGMLGSQAIAGQVTGDWLKSAVDADGIRLLDALEAQGLTSEGVLAAERAPEEILAFIELHIEQGPVLETEGLAIGIVDSISGVCNLQVRLEGKANHSGTTPMHLRADAFAGLAEIAAAIPAMIASAGGDQSRITIGKVDLAPNFPHTIPGLAEFSVILRDPLEGAMVSLRERFCAEVTKVAAKHRLSATVETRSWLPPVALDKGLAALLREEAELLGLKAKLMPSGAGHDAQTMQANWPSALIFVPSRDGISHAPEEWTDWGDIEKGATLFLQALIRLSKAVRPDHDVN